MSTPILGEFDPSVPKKRPHFRREAMEESRGGASKDCLPRYDDMLACAFRKIHEQNGEAGAGRKLVIPQLRVERKGKKTWINNFAQVCEALKRSPEEVKQYICAEQNIQHSALTGDDQKLWLEGRVEQIKAQNLLAMYVRTYVKCPVCGSMDTKLEKKNRLLFIVCNQCTAQRSVDQVKSGYKADTSKRKRRK